MKELKQEIQLEQAEFINRLMIDASLSENDIKIGLCLLHEILLKMKEVENNVKQD